MPHEKVDLSGNHSDHFRLCPCISSDAWIFGRDKGQLSYNAHRVDFLGSSTHFALHGQSTVSILFHASGTRKCQPDGELSKGNGADVVIKVKVDDSTGTITFNAEKLGDKNVARNK